MSETVQFLSGPARSGKTGRLLERCRLIAGAGTVLWLTPSLRRADQLRARLAGVPGLLLLTFEELAGALIAANEPDVRPLPRCQARPIIDEILAELLQGHRLSHFERVAETRGFAEGVAGLLGELQRAGVQPGLFRQAIESVANETPKLGQLAELYALYRQRLDSLQLVDPDARLSMARDILRRQPKTRPLEELRAVFVDDFRSFTAPQRDLLQLFAGVCEEVWISQPEEERARGGTEVLPVTPVLAIAGLAYLERKLFLPVRQVQPAHDASGLQCLQAPGLVGEARMVARQVKMLLLEGVVAEDIVLSARDLTPYANLLREVFDEYGIPIDIEGIDSLLHDPAVALLLRTLRLPDDDWPFAGVTALLRSSFVQPRWQEARVDPELPLLSEALLRLLGEPRGREAYLESIRRWSTQLQKGLEDEQAQESRRRKTHELAKQCGPFLERFFRSWDEMPHNAPLADHVAWLRSFTDDLGLDSASSAWNRFRVEVAHWVAREGLAQRPRPIDRKTFQRQLHALAATAGVARTHRGPGRVRILSAPLACDLDIEYLFLLGLGERGFPQLATPTTLLDESERQALRSEGLDLVCMGDLLSEEMSLFYRLVTRARKKLVLSYPAVDDRGQPLLPSSFLSAVLDLFEPGAVPVERRSMLIEGFDRDIPLSPAEQRVRLALASGEAHKAPRSPMLDNLDDARALALQRFRKHELSPFEGMFRDPRVIAEVSRQFGPERVFSPTALEDYVACPFRFYLGHVLRLDPLEEPTEDIEVTRRGQSFHRALSRLHLKLRAAGVHQPADGLEAEMHLQLSEAINEDIARTPGPASKKLWELEGQRMLKLARRYPEQWKQLVAPWLPKQVQPQPYFFEIDFGLPAEEGSIGPYHGPLVIRGEGIEVRVSGRIDRVDVAEMGDEVGFWIIDYKSGRGDHYTSKALVEFQRLQLTLYALAVEEVLLADRKARPLGLAYWLLTETGPKVVLPARNSVLWLSESERWRVVRQTLTEWIVSLVRHIRAGVYPLRPRSEQCTQTCHYGQVCRISQARSIDKDWSLPLPVLPANQG